MGAVEFRQDREIELPGDLQEYVAVRQAGALVVLVDVLADEQSADFVKYAAEF